LLIAIAASPLSEGKTSLTQRLRVWTTLPLAAAIVYAMLDQFRGYKPNLVDCPELAGLLVDPAVFVVVCALGLASLAWWVFAARAGSKCYIYVFVPVAVAFSAVYINTALRQRLLPDAYDRAALFAQQYLPKQTIADVLVVGSDTGELLRALFHLDSPHATMQVVANGAPFDLSSLPAGKDWLLAIGDHPLVGAASFVLQMDGFVLAQAGEILRVDFRRPLWPGLIDAASGLSYAESWGTWSNGDSIALRFHKPLPAKFTVHLLARAFGPSAGSEIVVRVGSSAASFTLGESIEEKAFAMTNPDGTNMLTIAIPHPASPRDLGMSADSRNLGIGIAEMRIAPL
jgi:phosphoglycerol transferase